jgi:manganese/zinc/iron transport system substrate-binding protein
MMRVFVSLALFLSCLVGCSKARDSSSWFSDNGKVKVLCTTAMIHDLVQQIGQDKVDAFSLITGEIDPHSYELVKGDDEKLSFAQVVLGNGLNLEHGASLRYQLQTHRHVVYLGDEIQKRAPSQILHVDGELDPHVWMDISLWAEGTYAIVDALAKEDPENAHLYQKNGEALREEMLQQHAQLQEAMRQIPDEKRYLVTSHDAFHYFARAYLSQGDGWEVRCVAPEGLAPEGQLSTQDIQRVSAHLSKYQIQVVFPESNVSRDALAKVISCCSHPVRCSEAPLYGDAIGPGTYLEMIRHNVETLKNEWSR